MLDRFLRPKVFHAKTSALCASRKKVFIEKAHRNQKCEQCALVRLLMNPTVVHKHTAVFCLRCRSKIVIKRVVDEHTAVCAAIKCAVDQKCN